MKIFEAKEEDIECCHDTLKKEFVKDFIDGEYTHVRVDGRTFEAKKEAATDETIIFLWDEI
jgi:hypothetical protein